MEKRGREHQPNCCRPAAKQGAKVLASGRVLAARRKRKAVNVAKKGVERNGLDEK